jgi:predicted MPP superfamily phosphohydrolase
MNFIFYMIVYTLINLYILMRILGWISYLSKSLNKKYIKIGVVILYTICYLSPIVGYLLPISNFQKNIQEFANSFMGVLIYMLMVTSISDIIKLILFKIFKLKNDRQKMKQFFYVVGIIATIVVVGTSIYGLIHARNITVRNYNVKISKSIESEKKDLKIALIADLHLGYNIGYKMMEQMVEKINNQNVDLVLIAGDIFDNSSVTVDDIEKCQKALSKLNSTDGVYAVFGNHDVEERLFCGFSVQSTDSDYRNEEMEDMLKSAGIRILDDEVTLIKDSLYIVGRKDAEKSGFGAEERKELTTLMENVDKSKTVIVLEHEPMNLEEISDQGVDLHLSGHTHAGQFFPLTIGTSMKWLNSYGMKQVGKMTSVVTSGIGVYGPNIRIGTNSEISIVNIQFDE